MHAVLAVLLLLPACFCQRESVTPLEADSCPPKTFTCADGSCIPADWVGDGEPDCDDHSDEAESTLPHHTPFNSTDNPFDDLEVEERLEAPTASGLTPSKSPSTSSPSTSSPSSANDCPTDQLDKVDQCSQPIFDFVRRIQTFDFNASSLLGSWMKIQLGDGCNLTSTFSSCSAGVNSACQAEPSVASWKSSEMLVCQLLLPSLREHPSCLARPRHPRCRVTIDRHASSMCRLLGSLAADMSCLQQLQPGDCSADATAMISPIHEECSQVAADMGCAAAEMKILSEEEAAAILTTTIPVQEEEEETTPETQESDIEGGDPFTPANSSTPRSKAEDKVELGDDSEPTTPAVDEEAEDEDEEKEETPSTSPSNSSTPTPSTAAPSTPTPSTAAPSTPTDSSPTSTATTTTARVERRGESTSRLSMESRPPLADALRSLQSISTICALDYSGSPWQEVHSVLCSFRSKVEKHADCIAATIAKAKCSLEKNARNGCDAIEAFNANLDCSLAVMNDECDVEAQNAVVEMQEKANDLLIEKKCFDEEKEKKNEPREEKKNGSEEFSLHPMMPPCSDDQENSALACLVELVEINKQLAGFQQSNFLLELSRGENSSVVSSVCHLYAKYESCLAVSVFSLNGGSRCAFASPLNSLARIGLAPICSSATRDRLSRQEKCLQKVAETGATRCQSALSSLGRSVQLMIQGVHGEALLCKSFFLIRSTFECGEAAVAQECDAAAAEDLQAVKQEMSGLGEQEGCPRDEPPSLQEILSRPPPRPLSAHRIARPLQPPPPHPVQPQLQHCDTKQQTQFQECVQPLTQYQPHPLIVIRQPRLIDEACQKFTRFQECVESVSCRPMWARGMTAMFEFACTEALEEYKEIRACMRKVSGEEVVRECVSTFSRGEPSAACLSANRLLSCSLPSISSSCGPRASSFVKNYVTRFASAIDSRCKVASQIPIGKVIGVGCSLEEEAIIDHCAAPLNDIGNRLDDIFQGGLQSVLKNANALAPVFAGGCNLTEEFKVCAAGILSSRSPCVLSSCMVQAGQGICSQADPVAAIDGHLSCVFSQVQEPSFARCIRSTLSTIKQFSLAAFKSMLPSFVDCVQEVVVAKCGETPIKVLRSISSPDVCPITSSNRLLSVSPVPQKMECTAEKKKSFSACSSPFFSKYRMLPVALLNESDNVDEFCSALDAMDGCSLSTRICSSAEESAFKAFSLHLCSTRKSFEQHKICLKAVAASEAASGCVSHFLTASPSGRCHALQTASQCIAATLRGECGEQSLLYAFGALAEYARHLSAHCEVRVPAVSLSTECSEGDLVSLLTCESSLDTFGPRPISFIRDASQWPSFCGNFSSLYSPCINKMSCKFEPASSANLHLYDSLCNQPITFRDQNNFAKCLEDYTNSVDGKKCIEPFSSLDLLDKKNGKEVCESVSTLLLCASTDIEKQCGMDALLHIYSLYSSFATQFDSKCSIESPKGTPDLVLPTPTLHTIHDSNPSVEVIIGEETKNVEKPSDDGDKKKEIVVDSIHESTTEESRRTMTSTTTSTETSTTSHSRDFRIRVSSTWLTRNWMSVAVLVLVVAFD